MAEALAGQCESFAFITGKSLFDFRQNVNLKQWYGLVNDFRIVRLPVYGKAIGQWMNASSYKRFARLAALYARLKQPDLVYARAVPAAAFCVSFGLPTIVETHSFPDHNEFRSLLPIIEDAYFVGLVTVTKYLKDKYLESGVPESKILVCPDAVNLENFRTFLSREVSKQELGLPLDKPIATYCGHFYPNKGVEWVIEAARMLPGVFFCLVGGWPEDVDRMKKVAGGLKNILFTGFVPNMLVPQYLSASEFLLLPNSNQYAEAESTSPLKLFEYMAAKRPIVASDIPAFRDVLLNMQNAYLVRPDSAEAIVAGIEALRKNPNLCAQLVERAWQDVQEYTWTNRASKILRHFLPSRNDLRCQK
jgi:glycosyltransferase involved in cell wall biosynthesis